MMRRVVSESRQLFPRREQLVFIEAAAAMALIPEVRRARYQQSCDGDHGQRDHDHDLPPWSARAEPRRVERRQHYDRAANERFRAIVQRKTRARRT